MNFHAYVVFLSEWVLFVCGVDDASGSCCCWVESAAFLGLASQEYLLQVLEKHERIVVKNYGDIFDSSCHDLTFCVESAEGILSTCDEFVLGSLISSPALFTTSWVSTRYLKCE